EHDLDGDLAVGLGVAGAVDGAHAAGGDVLHHLVLAHAHDPALPARAVARAGVVLRPGSGGGFGGHVVLCVAPLPTKGLPPGSSPTRDYIMRGSPPRGSSRHTRDS